MTASAGGEHRVMRLDLWVDGAFDRILSQAPGVSLSVIPCTARPADVSDLLAGLQVYQVSAAKDEVPREWFASEELIARMPNLVAVSSSGAGYDTVDVDACTRAGIAVVNQAGGNATSVAEMTMGLTLALYRRIAECDRAIRAGTAQLREHLMGTELHGRTMGLVGLGNIGRRVAALASAFGMKVIASDPYLQPADFIARGAQQASLSQVLADADVVSLHCPRNAETMKMIGADEFAQMKPGALFISTARGGIHDEAALEAAMASGRVGGAGLDVWDAEPPPVDHPLLARDNVIATFHTAGVTHEARRTMAEFSATQILDILHGRRPPRLINPDTWPRALARLQEMGRP